MVIDAETLKGVALVITAVATLYNVIVTKRNGEHIKRVEHATNGMKAELVDEVRKASFAAGEKSEKDKGQEHV